MLGLVALVLVLTTGVSSAEPRLRVGVIPARCDTVRTPVLAAAGLATVVIDVAWARWQPVPGDDDDRYVAEVRSRVDTCRRAGLAVVLAPGLQYPPAWVRSLPHGVYQDQTGRALVEGPVNLVFSQAVRDAAAGYLRAVATTLAGSLQGVRVGTTASGELGYPGPSDGASALRDFWAFDAAAQGGPGLAAGAQPSPARGWVPGSTSWRGRPFPSTAAREWLRWYARSLADAVVWQGDVLTAAGFRGEIHLPVAGRGVSPNEAATAVQALLDGPGDPHGDVERGLIYAEQIPRLAARLGPRLVVDVTGLDDASAVRARALSPPQDTCQADDVDRVVDGAGVESWPSFRWTSALARANGLRLVGENPGPPTGPETGADPDSDPLSAQLHYAPSYARGCGVGTLFVAFEDAFFGAQGGLDSADLAAVVAGASAR